MSNDFDVVIQSLYEDSYEEAKKTLYSMWIDRGEEFTPAVNLRTCNKLPSGVYKVAYENNDYIIKSVNLSTDEIYSFSESLIEKIVTEINKFWSKKQIYRDNNLIHKRGLLLEGEAGTGKTSIISLLIKELISLGGLVFLVTDYKDFSILYDALNPIIRKIEPERPITTIIEDVDKLIAENNGNEAEILDFLDGKGTINDHVVLMTSNNTSDLSEAFLRPSRVDLRFIIPNPSQKIREEYFAKKGLTGDALTQIVSATDNMSFAELKEVFIGTQILEKPLQNVIDQILNPIASKDYLTNNSKLGF